MSVMLILHINLLLRRIWIHKHKDVCSFISVLKSSEKARKFMPMSPNVYFREMKLMSQMQHSLTNWMKIAKLVQPYLEVCL